MKRFDVNRIVAAAMLLLLAGTLDPAWAEATVIPISADYTIDISIIEIDGNKVNVQENRRFSLAPGKHRLRVKLTEVPPKGMSLVPAAADGILDQGSNRTFEMDAEFDARDGHEYTIAPRGDEEKVFVVVFDETANTLATAVEGDLKTGKFKQLLRF